MDYSQLLARCGRIISIDPNSKFDLLDLVRTTQQFPAGITRHVIAEMLAREMAEFIEAEIKVQVPPRKH